MQRITVKGGDLSLFDVTKIRESTARTLGRETDAITRDTLHSLLRSRIGASAVPIFAPTDEVLAFVRGDRP
jgi:predicted nucleotidyltransferase